MSYEAFHAYEALRARLERSGPDDVAPSTARRAAALGLRLLAYLTRAGLVLALPFLVLVGGGVLAYRALGFPSWLALTCALVLSAVLVAIYGARASYRLTGRVRLSRRSASIALGLVGAYCIYALLYLSALNVKDPSIRGYYRSLHPLLRIAVSTFILVDRDLMITDMERVPEDYARMGLPVHPASRHYVQPDGYVHALDLRTLGRGWLRNLTLQGYFRILGFRTVRHVGTADHLHVALPAPR